MVEGENMGVGKIYRDGKGAGRLYIPKRLMKLLNFENGEQVLIKIRDNCMEVRKLEDGEVNYVHHS